MVDESEEVVSLSGAMHPAMSNQTAFDIYGVDVAADGSITRGYDRLRSTFETLPNLQMLRVLSDNGELVAAILRDNGGFRIRLVGGIELPLKLSGSNSLPPVTARDTYLDGQSGNSQVKGTRSHPRLVVAANTSRPLERARSMAQAIPGHRLRREEATSEIADSEMPDLLNEDCDLLISLKDYKCELALYPDVIVLALRRQ
jgi:hypothetical protein